MLVITRRVGEKVMIEHEQELLEIEVLEDGGQVRLGFVGPRSFRVHRSEIRERMRSGAPRRRRLAPEDDAPGGAASDAA